MTRMFLVLTCCGCLALAAACPGSGASRSEAREAPRPYLRLDPGSPALKYVKLELVKEDDRAAALSLTGRLSYDEDATQRVASPIDGRVTALLVHPGDRVTAGKAVVRLSSPQVGQIQSDALKAQSDRTLSDKALARARVLRANGAISEKDVAQIEADHRKAAADVARTTAQLKALGISAADPAVHVSLYARVTGVVAERNVLVGQEVRADQVSPLLTISDLSTLWAVADVYEQDLELVRPGAEVKLEVPAYPGKLFRGRVGHVGEVVDAATRTVKLRCVIPNPEHRLKPEMLAKIEIQAAADQKITTIPSTAVLTDGGRTRVIVASEDHVFRMRDVDVGPERDERVRVAGGVRRGERIVTQGAIFLQQEILTQ